MTAAIQIRYLSPTNHRPPRIKAFAEVGYGERASITESLGDGNLTDQVKRLAIRFCNEWCPDQIVAGFGNLPTGRVGSPDWVATLESRYNVSRGRALILAQRLEPRIEVAYEND